MLAGGTRVGRYAVIEQLGAGGVGVVYKAYDPELDRAVALKLLRAGRRSSEDTDTSQSRLLREAQALAKLSHPNVITIYDVGSFQGDVFLAMEYVQGETLRAWLERKPALPAILDTFTAAGRGLAAAHAVGLVHRDFKPENVWLGDDGRVRVLDFGLARLTNDTISSSELRAQLASADHDAARGDGPDSELRLRTTSSDSAASGERLTRTGTLMGTPRYMAPEQHQGGAVDARTDQFAFCVALFEAVYGDRPFAGRDMHELGQAVMRGQLREPKTERKVPARVRRAIARGLATRALDRHADMRALLRELERGRLTRSRYALTASAAVAMGLAATGWLLVPSADEHALCRTGAPQLRRAWNPDIAKDVHAAFLATDKPYAERNFTAFTAAVDRYVAQLRAARDATCAAPEEAGASALRAARLDCISDRASELGAFIDVYRAELDGDALASAVPAAHRLTAVELCATAQPPPRSERGDLSASERARITDLRRELAKARGLSVAGHDQACADLVSPLLADVEAMATPRLYAETALLLGVCEGELQDLALSRRHLELAVKLATQAGDPNIETAAWVALIGSLCVNDGRPTAAHALLPAAEAALARAGTPPYLETRLLAMKAMIADAFGEYDDAIELESRALALMLEHAPDDRYRIAVLHNNVAVSYARRGRDTEAEQHLREAIAIDEAELGPDHPLLGNAYNTLGGVLYDRGDFAAAEAAWRRSLAVREAAHGTDHPLVARVLPNLSMLAFEDRDFEQAERLLERSLANQSSLGPNHPESVGILVGLADIALERGDAGRARSLCDKAASILAITQVAATHEDRPWVLSCEGRALLEQGQFDRAVSPLTETLTLLASGDVAQSARLEAIARFSLARALWPSPGSRPRALIEALRALLAYERERPTPQLEHERAALRAWLCARRDAVEALAEAPEGSRAALRCD